MEDQEYACYEVKLNRVFNIQSKQNLIWLSVLSALFIFYIVINLIKGKLELTGRVSLGRG